MERKSSMERFRVSGNVLKLTSRFDPRYQSRAGMEMMNIVSGLAVVSAEPEVVIDVSDADAFPSMMIGMLCEARDVAERAGKHLKIRIKTTAYNRLESLGLAQVFSSPPSADGICGDLELVADAVAPNSDAGQEG